MIAVWGRVVLFSTYLGVVVLDKSSNRFLGSYLSWLGGGIDLDRTNGEYSIFFM